MLLHSIIAYQRGTLEKMGIPTTEAYVRFAVFIVREIFRGGQLPEPDWVTAPAERAGFGVDQIQPLQLHYARTLDRWAAAFAARHDDAVKIASEEIYQRYMKYLTGCPTSSAADASTSCSSPWSNMVELVLTQFVGF
ncbi:class I SAM-dependent methyltransferase [Rhodococcus koreensis]